MATRKIAIETQDGSAPALIVHPDISRRAPAANRPGVVLYMDAFGLRPALEGMAQRLADAGYIVLVPDLLYRFGAYGPFDAKTAFSDEASRTALMGMIKGTSQEMTQRDTGAFLQALEQEGATGRIGTVGYCMGGARALNGAAAYPDRIAAAASFHGGNLAADTPDSPHRHVATMRARVYVGSAGIDKSFPPDQSARLELALREAEIDHVIENYVGMGHGWAVPDHGEYNPEGAERHWKRLLTFFEETLG
ncbi:dienelactone hydrolase family protein [Microvirga puerhi]|uniref:Dienelactone hydrolase family protein n=1 Tax=Microvirga puerhi TaxID=2876078 RepID=A0ABS7VNK0_9HYPH|nr:dienelactone hydrolase family protein [Microvirga puerhi]